MLRHGHCGRAAVVKVSGDRWSQQPLTSFAVRSFQAKGLQFKRDNNNMIYVPTTI